MNPEQIRQIVRQEIASQKHSDQFTVSNTSFHKHTGVGVDGPQISQSSILPGTRVSGNITFASNATYQLGITFNPTSILFYGNAVRRDYTFTVTAANATLGATYTNNTHTYTVLSTIAGGTTLEMVGTGAPEASGTLTKASGTGDATITFASSTHLIKVRAMCTGSAAIGGGFYFQPNTGTSVQTGKDKENIVQSSAMFLVDSFTSPLTVRAISDETNIIDVEYSVDYGTSISGIVARSTIQSVTSKFVNILVVLATGWEINGNYVVT